MNNTLKCNWTRWDHSNGWEHTQLKTELHFPIEFLLFHCYLMLYLMLLDAYLMLYLLLYLWCYYCDAILDAILDATWCVISNGSAQLSYRVLEGNSNILQQCWVPIFYFNMWTDERWPELFCLKPKDNFGTWRKWFFFFFVNAEFYRVVWTINALLVLTIRSEMLPFSGNIQKIKMFGVPPNTLP